MRRQTPLAMNLGLISGEYAHGIMGNGIIIIIPHHDFKQPSCWYDNTNLKTMIL
jgi:hypothetical protein